jgi:hypothetical protein
MGLKEFFRNGLALDPDPPDPELESFMDALAGEIASRRLAPLAVLLISSGMPLSFLMSQFMVFAEPLVQTFFPTRSYKGVVSILEERTRVERFLRIIEARELARKSPEN